MNIVHVKQQIILIFRINQDYIMNNQLEDGWNHSTKHMRFGKLMLVFDKLSI